MVVFRYKFPFSTHVIRQVIPCLCGGILTVTFGLMLGWPSVAYPHLLDPTVSPIIISMDQTALIAGFLMEGNSVGAIFSTTKLLTSKTAVFISACIQLIGMVTLLGGNDIYALLIARSFVGFGHGFGVPQLKRYVKETCEPKIADVINTYLQLGINIGVIISYILGTFLSYRKMAACFIISPVICLVTFGVIPKRKFILASKAAMAQVDILQQCSQNVPSNVVAELEENHIENGANKQLTLIQAFKNRDVRCAMWILMLIIFIKQYTGGPANIVYSQMIFTHTNVDYPKYCSIAYSFIFLIFTVISLKYAKKFYRKQNLLLSCFVSAVTMGTMALYYHMKYELMEMSNYFTWAPLFLLTIYNAFHTFGLAVCPLLIIEDLAPKNGRNYLNKLQSIHWAMSAVISTKLFQVFFTYYSFSAAYIYLTVVAAVGFVSILIFVPETKTRKIKSTTEVNGNSKISRDMEKGEITTL